MNKDEETELLPTALNPLVGIEMEDRDRLRSPFDDSAAQNNE
ncbi:hypothetical protein [Metabacillus endolithicus]|uniref:Uncharacterized protein n=1 Tax=Metabacillus endolithicus TaxID=1535204 RepID=A0ABW5C2Y4_9BACI|nr:hypothetical protein [Metabacillus endolithicus]